jgi:nucleotide-binding universal stress UspA family protein
MISLKRILVPTDFSDASQNALRYGMALAESFSAELHVLHVVVDPYVIPPGGEGYLPPPDLPQQLEKTSRAHLEQWVPADWRKEHTAVLECIHGTPFVEIVRYAREKEIDLIVMGTHGRGAIAHILMGSVAERVVRKAPCPVLTVRPKEHEFVMP